MVKLEYRVKLLSNRRLDLQAALCEKGAEGWRLVSLTLVDIDRTGTLAKPDDGHSDFVLCIFERSLSERGEVEA